MVTDIGRLSRVARRGWGGWSEGSQEEGNVVGRWGGGGGHRPVKAMYSSPMLMLLQGGRKRGAAVGFVSVHWRGRLLSALKRPRHMLSKGSQPALGQILGFSWAYTRSWPPPSALRTHMAVESQRRRWEAGTTWVPAPPTPPWPWSTSGWGSAAWCGRPPWQVANLCVRDPGRRQARRGSDLALLTCHQPVQKSPTRDPAFPVPCLRPWCHWCHCFSPLHYHRALRHRPQPSPRPLWLAEPPAVISTCSLCSPTISCNMNYTHLINEDWGHAGRAGTKAPVITLVQDNGGRKRSTGRDQALRW